MKHLFLLFFLSLAVPVAAQEACSLSALHFDRQSTTAYPSIAKATQIVGRATVQGVVATDGGVSSAESDGAGLLRVSAEQFVKAWRVTDDKALRKPCRFTAEIEFRVVPKSETVPYTTRFVVSQIKGTQWHDEAASSEVAAPREGDSCTDLRIARSATPRYPEAAVLNQSSGQVRIRLQVGSDAQIKDVTVLDSSEIFRDAAAQYVKSWQLTWGSQVGPHKSCVEEVYVNFQVMPEAKGEDAAFSFQRHTELGLSRTEVMFRPSYIPGVQQP